MMLGCGKHVLYTLLECLVIEAFGDGSDKGFEPRSPRIMPHDGSIGTLSMCVVEGVRVFESRSIIRFFK